MLSFDKFIFLLIIVLHHVVAEECNTDSSDNFERALHRKLLCNYDKSVRPVKNHTTKMVLAVGMSLRSLQSSYDRASVDTFELGAWLSLVWTDEFLTWDPAVYGNIREITLHSSTIWLPDFGIFSSESKSIVVLNKPCGISYNGRVSCVEQVQHTVLCSKDYKKWPFDTQHCTAVYGTWATASSNVNVTSRWKNVDVKEYHENKYWKLLSINVTNKAFVYGEVNDTYTLIIYNFLVKRNAVTTVVEYGTPIFVLMILAIGSLLLSINSIERIILMLANTYLHINYIHNISYVAPAVGGEVPDAVTYFQDALILSCFILMHGVAMRVIIKRRTPVPNWIVDVTGIIDTRPGRIMFHEFDPALSPSEGVDDIEQQSSSGRQNTDSNDWKRFALFLNRLFIIFVILFYMYITIRYLV